MQMILDELEAVISIQNVKKKKSQSYFIFSVKTWENVLNHGGKIFRMVENC